MVGHERAGHNAVGRDLARDQEVAVIADTKPLLGRFRPVFVFSSAPSSTSSQSLAPQEFQEQKAKLLSQQPSQPTSSSRPAAA